MVTHTGVLGRFPTCLWREARERSRCLLTELFRDGLPRVLCSWPHLSLRFLANHQRESLPETERKGRIKDGRGERRRDGEEDRIGRRTPVHREE